MSAPRTETQIRLDLAAEEMLEHLDAFAARLGHPGHVVVGELRRRGRAYLAERAAVLASVAAHYAHAAQENGRMK